MPKRRLDKDYTYRGVFYAAGPLVEVPEGFRAGSPAKAAPKKQEEKQEDK